MVGSKGYPLIIASTADLAGAQGVSLRFLPVSLVDDARAFGPDPEHVALHES